MVEAILWDNDGVLVDTECLFFESTRTILDTIGIQLSLRQFLDLSMREGRSAFELAIERGWGRQQVAELKRERDLLYSEMLRKQTRVLPDVPETLQQLQGRMRMAVVSTSQRQHFDVMHSDTGLMRYFEFVLAREDFRETKPNPEPYLLALERLQMKADNCVAVEDSERGLAAARAAGLRCLVIPNDMTRVCNFRGATAILPRAAVRSRRLGRLIVNSFPFHLLRTTDVASDEPISNRTRKTMRIIAMMASATPGLQGGSNRLQLAG